MNIVNRIIVQHLGGVEDTAVLHILMVIIIFGDMQGSKIPCFFYLNAPPPTN